MTTEAKERTFSIVMVASLLVSVGLAIYAVATFGVSGMFAQLPNAGTGGVFLISAIFLFIVAGTDYAAEIRKSRVLRRLTMTWAIWQFLFYFLSVAAKETFVNAALPYFISATATLILYSMGIVYRSLRARK